MSDVVQQAEVFIGNKTDITAWGEDDPKKPLDRIKPLTLLNSSNHLFADFQPHNSNVFSLLDDFTYQADSGQTTVMQHAQASYYVIGWHADPTEDPFYIPADVATTHQIRINALMMDVPDAGKGGPVDSWMGASDSTASLCHGAVYDVTWIADQSPAVVPARDAAAQLTKNKPNIPVAIGSTPTDALITYVGAHKDTETGTIKELETDLWAIQTLLLAQDDGADAQLEAKDLLYNHGYERSDGGTVWHMSGADNGAEPTDTQKTNLELLYKTQFALDNAIRTLRFLRWQLFSVWWKYVSGAFGNPVDVGATVATSRVAPLVNRINMLLGRFPGQDPTSSIAWLVTEQSRLSKDLPLEQGASPSFYQKKDPTLMIGGIEAGWPADYLDSLIVRLDFQLPQYDVSTDSSWSEFDKPTTGNGLVQTIVSKLPQGLGATLTSLLREFRALETSTTQPSPGKYAPLYHDQGPKDPDNAPPTTAPWRDRWYGQPWFPLFVEWEADYFHIPFDDFDLSARLQNDSASAQTVLRYGIRSGVDLMGKVNDVRRVSGRILLLPQPSFSLKSAVTQLFRNMQPADLDQHLIKTERDFLLKNIGQLEYLSHPLSGITDHLVTRVNGTHIKPNQRPPGEALTAMDAAVVASKLAGIGSDEILLQDAETHVTPYGRSIAAVTYDGSASISPLKPVTHGQLRLTALNVIDKFGQAICALDPKPVPLANLPHVAPALSDIYICQENATNAPNVVAPGLEPPACEFLQFTPAINQPARLNSYFVVQDPENTSTWRPAYDWESPIWGWAVINYVEYALQLFLPDGTFYREVVHGGINKDTLSPGWSPFAKGAAQKVPKQLDDLIVQLGNDAYLEAFFTMIDDAFALLPPAPGSYAQYLNSIVGKPLALTNAGFSLELSTPALQNESVLNDLAEDRYLLPPSTPMLPTGRDPAETPKPDPKQAQYSFKMQLGDATRAYDGLVGFFKPLKNDDNPGAFDMSTIFTFWPTVGFAGTVGIAPDNFPVLTATFVSPDVLVNPDDTNGGTALKSREAVAAERNANLGVVACVMDPFTAVHAYSDLLPVQALKLPEWTTERALKKMTAFFKVGPLLVTADVPAWSDDLAKHVLQPTDAADAVLPGSQVAVPSVGKAGWAWLQPYRPPPQSSDAKAASRGRAVRGVGDKIQVDPPPYVALGVGVVDGRPRFEDSPYTVVEGYLRQTAPLESPEVKPS